MFIPRARVGCWGPFSFLALTRSQCAIQGTSHHVTQLDGQTQPDLPDAADRVPAAEVRARATATRLLIIDDNVGTLDTFASAFRRCGFQVSEAASGAAGLAVARSASPHVVVADQCLPDLTGLEVLAQLRAVGSNVPVVVISGWPTPELRERAEELGACEFLAKPVWLDQLLEVVQRAVQVELPSTELEVARRAEPASQTMSEIRQLAAGLTEHGVGTASAATETSVVIEARRRLLHKLIQVAVRRNLSVSEMLAVAEAIRRTVRALDDVAPSELAQTVLDALAPGGMPRVQRPLHAKVIEAVAHLAGLDGRDLRLSEPDLADAVHISVSRLSRLLRPQTGLDLRQWKRGFRARKAVQGLERTDTDVSEIADRLGYNDVSEFDDEFHSLFGLTPREFRKFLRGSTASC